MKTYSVQTRTASTISMSSQSSTCTLQYAVVRPDGQMVFASTLVEAAIQAHQSPGTGNYIFKVVSEDSASCDDAGRHQGTRLYSPQQSSADGDFSWAVR